MDTPGWRGLYECTALLRFLQTRVGVRKYDGTLLDNAQNVLEGFVDLHGFFSKRRSCAGPGGAPWRVSINAEPFMKSRKSKILIRLMLLASAYVLGTAPATALDVGQSAPPFSLPGHGGGTSGLSAMAGHVVYLDFWASWCGPCRQSFPWMNQLQAKYASRGLRVLAVNVDSKQSDAEGFLTQIPAQFRVVFDPKGTTPDLYQIKGMPTSFLIGADGKVLVVHQGFHESDRKDLESAIDAAMSAAHPKAAR
jgi:cytochrome c biogenesis protein CcmG, thiol:disulfide interchange protein DsbE